MFGFGLAKIFASVALVAAVAAGVGLKTNNPIMHKITSNLQEMMGKKQQPKAAAEISARNSSNTSLDQDLKTIDIQMSALAKDSASVEQGFNDRPISQN